MERVRGDLDLARLLIREGAGLGLAANMAPPVPAAGVSAQADEAYGLVKSGVLRGVSVGFKPLESKPAPNGHGRVFTRVLLFEILLVSLPANANALLAARLGGKGDRPLVVDGAPLTPARLGAILRETRSESAAPRYVVTRATELAAVKEALPAIATDVPRVPAKAILRGAGRLDAGAGRPGDPLSSARPAPCCVTREAKPRRARGAGYCSSVHSDTLSRIRGLLSVRATEAPEHIALDFAPV